MSSTVVPPITVSPEVEAFAAEKGVTEYLPRVLEMARRLFPEYPIVVTVYEDHEIRDLKKILIAIQLASDLDFKTIGPRHRAWAPNLFAVCPATHVHAFGLTFETVQ
jgi:hypothetical protein